MRKIFTAIVIALVACAAVFATGFDMNCLSFQFNVHFTLATDADAYLRFRSSEFGIGVQYDFGRDAATDLVAEADISWEKGMSDDSCVIFETGITNSISSFDYEAKLFVETPFDGYDIVAPTIGIKGAGVVEGVSFDYTMNAGLAFSIADFDAGSGLTLGAGYIGLSNGFSASAMTTMRIVDGTFCFDDTTVEARYEYSPVSNQTAQLTLLHGLEFRYAYDRPVDDNGFYFSTEMEFQPSDSVSLNAGFCGSFHITDDVKALFQFNHGELSIEKNGSNDDYIKFSIDYTDRVFLARAVMNLPVDGLVYALGTETTFKAIIEDTDIQYLGTIRLKAFFESDGGSFLMIPDGMASVDIYFINTLDDDCWGFSSDMVVAKPMCV